MTSFNPAIPSAPPAPFRIVPLNQVKNSGKEARDNFVRAMSCYSPFSIRTSNQYEISILQHDIYPIGSYLIGKYEKDPKIPYVVVFKSDSNRYTYIGLRPENDKYVVIFLQDGKEADLEVTDDLNPITSLNKYTYDGLKMPINFDYKEYRERYYHLEPGSAYKINLDEIILDLSRKEVVVGFKKSHFGHPLTGTETDEQLKKIFNFNVSPKIVNPKLAPAAPPAPFPKLPVT